MPRPRQGWGEQVAGLLRPAFCAGGDAAQKRSAGRRENRVRAGRSKRGCPADDSVRRKPRPRRAKLSNRLPRARRAPPRRREIVKKSLRLAARACHLLSICYDGSAAAAGPPPRMAARGTRRGDARGSGKPSPHSGCAMPCTGRPREREAIPPEVKRRVMAGDARGSGKPRYRCTANATVYGTPAGAGARGGAPAARAGYGGTPARHAGSRGAA